MKIKQIVAAMMIMMGIAITPVVVHADGLQCGVLPQSFCSKADNGKLENSGMWAVLLLVVRILAGAVGLVAVGMIVVSGITYTAAQSSGDQVKKAKDMILNVAIGLLLFALMYALIEWLIPGGVFS